MKDYIDHSEIQVGSSLWVLQDTSCNVRCHIACNIPPNLFEQAQKWLRNYVIIEGVQGNEVVDFPAWKVKAIYFYDPAGNIMELIARDELPNKHSQESFEFEDILPISEFGIPITELNTLEGQLFLSCYSQFGPVFKPKS